MILTAIVAFLSLPECFLKKGARGTEREGKERNREEVHASTGLSIAAARYRRRRLLFIGRSSAKMRKINDGINQRHS